MNIQPIEKQNLRVDMLEVHSVFLTIQGEGPFVGRTCVFVRLTGCNLQCPLCDTEYTSNRQMLDADDLMHVVKREAARSKKDVTLIVITGGEPLRQNVVPFLWTAFEHGFQVQIETNGSLYVEGLATLSETHDLTIVCSPKAGKVNKQLQPLVDAWKYVATADSLCDDGLPKHALEHPAAPRLFRPPADSKVPVYLQPVDEVDPARNQANLSAVVASCMRHGHLLGLQVHKLIGVP